MFLSTIRPILFPQTEHLKLAGALAFLWSNAQFELPPVAHLSMVAGMALHDRAYGCLDDMPIPSPDTARWLALTRRGFFMPCADPLADLITRLHLLRLVSSGDTPAHRALADEMRAVIAQQAAQHHLNLALLHQIDRMNDFCDRVSFDFCREKPVEGQLEVVSNYTRAETRLVRYRIEGSEITLDPWPLRVSAYEGYIIGYAQEGYPEHTDGIVVPFSIHPA